MSLCHPSWLHPAPINIYSRPMGFIFDSVLGKLRNSPVLLRLQLPQASNSLLLILISFHSITLMLLIRQHILLPTMDEDGEGQMGGAVRKYPFLRPLCDRTGTTSTLWALDKYLLNKWTNYNDLDIKSRLIWIHGYWIHGSSWVLLRFMS